MTGMLWYTQRGLHEVRVIALVVPDEIQKVSLIVGQPFVNHGNVVVVVVVY